MSSNHWLLNGKEFTNPSPTTFGFVYLITNTTTNRKYIGKKQFFFSRRKHGAKVLIPSDWRDYYGSSESLLQDIAIYGRDNFKREILSLHTNKRDLSYTEMQEQFKRNVLEDDLYYNDCIGGKWFRYHGTIIEKESINIYHIDGNDYYCHNEAHRKARSDHWKIPENNPNNFPNAAERQRNRLLNVPLVNSNPRTEMTKTKISMAKTGKNNPRILLFDGEEILPISKYMAKHRIGYYSVIDDMKNGLILTATDEQMNEYTCGKMLSDDHKEKLRCILRKNREAGKVGFHKGFTYKKISCPHCGIVGGVNVMKRHHMEKCKSLQPHSSESISG